MPNEKLKDAKEIALEFGSIEAAMECSNALARFLPAAQVPHSHYDSQEGVRK